MKGDDCLEQVHWLPSKLPGSVLLFLWHAAVFCLLSAASQCTALIYLTPFLSPLRVLLDPLRFPSSVVL